VAVPADEGEGVRDFSEAAPVLGVTVRVATVVGVFVAVAMRMVVPVAVGVPVVVVRMVVTAVRVVVGTFVLASAVVVAVPVEVLSNPERDEGQARDDTDRPADSNAQHFERFVDSGQTEVPLGEEERDHHSDGTHEVAEPEEKTRCEAVEPLVRLVQRVTRRDRPAVARLDAVGRAERDRSGEQPECVTRYHAVRP
jgi:hypothetical protein